MCKKMIKWVTYLGYVESVYGKVIHGKFGVTGTCLETIVIV